MKIPDDVFENRCRYCLHGQVDNGNEDVQDSKIFASSYLDKLSCKIFGIAQCNKVSGECLSFTPYMYFGICQTCQYDNCFVDGYCTRGEQPNKRKIFLGHGGLGGAQNPDYWMDHCLSTCDNYIVSSRWIDRIINAVSEGRAPANFDPTTLMPLEKCVANTVTKTWMEIREKARMKREMDESVKEVARRPLKEATRRSLDHEPSDQLTIFDCMEADPMA